MHNGDMTSDPEEHLNEWAEYFTELLNDKFGHYGMRNELIHTVHDRQLHFLGHMLTTPYMVRMRLTGNWNFRSHALSLAGAKVP